VSERVYTILIFQFLSLCDVVRGLRMCQASCIANMSDPFNNFHENINNLPLTRTPNSIRIEGWGNFQRGGVISRGYQVPAHTHRVTTFSHCATMDVLQHDGHTRPVSVASPGVLSQDQEGHDFHVHEIRHKSQEFLHKHNKLEN